MTRRHTTRWTITAALAALLTWCSPAPGAELALAVHLGSYHYDREREFCERNPGLGVQARHGRHGWAAGSYRNSLCHTTVYGLYQGELWRRGAFSLHGVAGLVTGYHYVFQPAAGLRARAGALQLDISHQMVGVSVVVGF